jgi:hypothetical protein
MNTMATARCRRPLLAVERCARCGLVERLLHRAIGQHPFVDLLDAFVEQFRLDDVEGLKDVGPRLVADFQRVAESFVVSSKVRSPLRSSSALVATVVPILTVLICSAGMRSLRATPIRSRMPWMAA